ncbi:BamA/OMP85 family outer membrane protein [Longimicrobium terrae]|uniref:Outer membrane protein assembly factor BamA n=1 Tax=Longimicrobium terrae TaxID=1639882 RepID=A0A841H0D1_9BACT|nr:outer membrane protein assembly factor [Longimicrobium terrae]MBB4637214.1 outer membrane protein assembly factor BamA [Longimicrobium terrae]MBB6071525.1 outer membrane protein assembly factor BamA [Longimicrobium terrae]NNC30054.1 BamA/TamA family outer membrane protein [Longimicrobium terrae]
MPVPPFSALRFRPRALLARAAALLCAAAGLAACAGNQAGPTGPLPQFAQYEGQDVRSVDFEADSLVVPADSLRNVITTQPSRCRALGVLPFCIGKIGKQDYNLDLGVLSRDVARIQLAHRDAGYYGTRVLPLVDEAPDGVNVTFRIEPGDRVTLTSLAVTGADSLPGLDRIRGALPLKEGEPFRRIDFLASVDTVRNWLLNQGYAYAQVLRNYEIDTIADVAQVELNAAPGPLVVVDSIAIVGLYRLSPETVRRQMAIRTGRPLRATDLVRSQRNLFDLELVNFAAVEVAPERLQATPDSAELDRDSIGSTVLVRIVEAPRYAVDVAGGYATRDCFRAQGSHLDRNFLGGARRLEITGLIAKVGVASPVDGLEKNLCPAFNPERRQTAQDSLIADQINYRLAANFLQPRLFGTQTSVVAGLFTEQISELDLYVRDATGSQVGIVRQIAPQTLASLTFEVQRGRTRASDYFFCIAFEVCRPGDIRALERPRWSNSVSLGLTQSRVRIDPFPSGGHQFRTTVDYASPALGSDDQYLRLMADGIAHRRLTGNLVLSARLMAGTFLTGLLNEETGYIPPEQRFYGGGPTGVRGFRFNELGPTVYVVRPRRTGSDGFEVDTISSSTGGTRSVLGSTELTFPIPLPLLNRPALRGAVFLDAGQVWDTRDTTLVRPGIRFTPGVGGRFATPVGPIRLDVGYNPYSREPGPLYGINERGELLPTPLLRRYQPDDKPGFLKRLTLQISVGNAL